jgi:hypothetical protein
MREWFPTTPSQKETDVSKKGNVWWTTLPPLSRTNLVYDHPVNAEF